MKRVAPLIGTRSFSSTLYYFGVAAETRTYSRAIHIHNAPYKGCLI